MQRLGDALYLWRERRAVLALGEALAAGGQPKETAMDIDRIELYLERQRIAGTTIDYDLYRARAAQLRAEAWGNAAVRLARALAWPWRAWREAGSHDSVPHRHAIHGSH